MATPGSVFRAILGAIGGGILGALIALMLVTALSHVIGDEGGFWIGVGLLMVSVPAALIVGAVIGGWCAARGTESPEFRKGARAAGVLLAIAVILRIALPDNRPKAEVEVARPGKRPKAEIDTARPDNGPKAEVDAGACRIVLQGGDVDDGFSIDTYDRYCPGVGGHTVNVSFTDINVPNSGPGNVFVLASDPTLDRESPYHGPHVFATALDSQHLLIQYDPRGRIVSQSTPVHGYEVKFQPDTTKP